MLLSIERRRSQFDVDVTPRMVEKYEFGDAGVFPRVLPRVTQVLEDSPAAAAGLRAGDELRSVDGRPVSDSRSFVEVIQQSSGRTIDVEVVRDGQELTLRGRARGPTGEARIGIGLGVLQRYGPARRWSRACSTTSTSRGRRLRCSARSSRSAGRSEHLGPDRDRRHERRGGAHGFRNLVYLMG